MAQFDYTALDDTGTTVSGSISAPDESAALDQLAHRKLHPISVTPTGAETRTRRSDTPARGRVSAAAVEQFIRQLANLLAAGVSLSRALELLAREASGAAAGARWRAIHDDVVGGSSLADALARFPRSFPPVYVAMVRAGETGGFLDLVLEQIAEFRTREADLKGKVKAALVYPTVLAVLAVGVVIFLMVYFIPRFSAIFANLGSALPWLTRVVVSISHVLMTYWPVILAVLALVVLGVKRVMAGDTSRRIVERVTLKLPVVGRVMAHFSLVRFARMLGTLLGAGVPLVMALKVAREAIGNRTLSDTVVHAVEQVQRGASLARSLGHSQKLFPPEVVEMVAVAETSGRLDKELIRVASAYEGELDRRLRILVALAEPALLFVMAGLVGTVVISMLLPIFALQDLIR